MDIPIEVDGLLEINNLGKEIGHSKHRKIIYDPIRLNQCEICLKEFAQQSNLWKHVLIHTGERPYECKICGKKFTQQANLSKHMLTHTGEKPHKCIMCGKAFSQQANLKKHIQLHTGEKRYCCDQCGKGFVQQVNLERHKHIHSPKLYPRDMCNNDLKKNRKSNHIYIEEYEEDYNDSNSSNYEISSFNFLLNSDNDSISEMKNDGYRLNEQINCPVKKNGIPVILTTEDGVIFKRL